jgi:CheY-like chemotaxis protein
LTSSAGGPVIDSRNVADGARVRVLVIDDDEANRALCSVTLRLGGFDVVEAANGRLGLELARTAQPDLVVLDVRMPFLDGFEVAAALRGDSRTAKIPFLFLSAEADPVGVTRAHALGAAGYLPKPFDPLALEALVTRALLSRESLKNGSYRARV